MKHILNNLTEQEKNAIREQHTGGMKVSTDKFNQLLESKLGDVKPILSEQTKSFDPKTFNPGTALIKPQKPEPEIVKVPDAMKTPKGKTIPVIKIKLADSNLIDLTIMDDTGYRGSSGAIFYGKFRNEKWWYQLHFYCNQDTVYHNFAGKDIGLHDGKISPEAVNLLNKAAGCDAYVKNQDTSSDDVTLAEQKSNLGMKSIDKDKNTFREVVKFIKSKGLNGYKFKESIEGDESLGIILEHPQDRTLTMWVEPNGEYLIAKKGKVFEEGKWNWDGMNQIRLKTLNT